MKYTFKTKDDTEAERIMKASGMASVLWEMMYNARRSVEYKIEEMDDPSAFDAIDLVFDHFRDLCDENDIVIDNLMR
jgi:hypothetical protein